MKLVARLALVSLLACKSHDPPPAPAPAPTPAPAAPAATPAPPAPADPAAGITVAGRDELAHQFFIARVTPQATTELFRDASEPSQLLWIDGHLLIAMFDARVGRGDDHDTVLRWFTDGQPSDKRGKGGEPIRATAWPAGFRGATTRLMFTRSGQVWLGRRAFEAGRPGKAMYMRVDAFPRRTQAEPPADVDVVRSNPWPLSPAAQQDEARLRRDALPRASAPDGYTLAQQPVAGGVPGVACSDGKHGKPTTWPTAATHPFQRIHVADAHWLSAQLPLWTAIGHNPDFPDGDLVDAAVFLGCTTEPLAELRWLGGDVWATLAGGAWTSAKDAKHWTLWSGATQLAVIAPATGVLFQAAPR